MENRRIGEIFRHIQESAIKVKNDPPRGNFMEIDDMSVEIKLIMERPMFAGKSRAKIESSELLSGDLGEIDTSALYEVMYVDTAALEENIKLELLHAPQITLAKLLERHPPEHGLAEIIAYMNIASKRDGSIFDDAVSDELSWRNGRGDDVAARAPRVIFTR
jgi:hypothetical protein